MSEPDEGANKPGRSRMRRVDLGKVLDDVLVGASTGTGPKALTNAVGMAFVLVPAGKFQMGSPADEPGHRTNEGPVHEVVIGNPFYFGVHPVTQAAYLAVTGKNPSRFTATEGGGPEHPVESVSWDDAVAFCRALSERPEERSAGRTYRLPIEAEWEYAARAGGTGPFAFGSDFGATEGNFDAARPHGTSAPAARTTPVSRYPATAWGLHDVHGNVWEWCADWYGEAYYSTLPLRDPPGPPAGRFRVLRGGSWKNQAAACRSAYRNALAPHMRDSATGFRVVLVV
ncbi:MAG: formylglycine-generating enzyme family protein [Planctomycetes bacterium]|nr:formylglycine-generating enzyme family protein [Planctomycetota bacterium]